MLFEMIRIIPRRFLWWLEVNKKPPKTNLDFSLPVQPAIRAGWMKSPYPHFSPGRQSHSHTLLLRRTFKRSQIKRIQLRIRNRLPWNSQTRLTQVEDHIAHQELQLQSLEIWNMWRWTLANPRSIGEEAPTAKFLIWGKFFIVLCCIVDISMRSFNQWTVIINIIDICDIS